MLCGKHVRTKSRPCVHCGEALLGGHLVGSGSLPSPPSYLPGVVALDAWVSLRNQDKAIRGIFLLHPLLHVTIPLLSNDSKSFDLHLQPTLEEHCRDCLF